MLVFCQETLILFFGKTVFNSKFASYENLLSDVHMTVENMVDLTILPPYHYSRTNLTFTGRIPKFDPVFRRRVESQKKKYNFKI